MELTVYRQSSKIRPDGTVVYKGEDARPYVDGQIFFVADGLGGAAAIRHQKIVPELFEGEKILDALFKGVYPDYGNEVFSKYVTDSFAELFAVKDCYTDNINNIKKSGYFASRLVTAVFLHEMLYNDEYNAEKIFGELSACETEESKNAYLSAFGNHFKQLIQTKIRQIAKNANLIYESSYSGLALLGSTLCATVYCESEDCVKAIYLTAGDSRPYVWSEKTGLCQVLEDQEGQDGGMTNYIKANEDADFEIRCDYLCFDKPCVLFNASDGCFDSGRFISQLSFEKTVLDGAVASDSPEALSEYLTQFFSEYGRHDDSSTIAMKMFGYESFDAFKTACANRLNVLQTEYFDKMSDLLDVDYIFAYEESERTLPNRLASLKDKFSAEPSVRDYCATLVQSEGDGTIMEKIRQIDAEIASKKQRIQSAEALIQDVIAANYVKFIGFVEQQNDSYFERIGLSKIEGAESRYQTTAREYMDRVRSFGTDFDEIVAAVKKLLSDIERVGVPTSFEDFKGVSFQPLEDCQKRTDALFDFIFGLQLKKSDLVKKMISQRYEYVARNRKKAEKNQQTVKKLCAMVIAGKIDYSEEAISESEKEEIKRQAEIIGELSASVEKLNADDKKQALEESCKSLWNSRYVEIISAVINNPQYAVDGALADEARAIIDEFNQSIDGLKEKSATQKALFEKYDTAYRIYIGGNQ